MRCGDCFHWVICGEASQYNDASMCKQYIHRTEVLYGSALKVVEEELERLEERNEQLDRKLACSEIENLALERELKLMRIIKQTLEMQSGMKFDF